MANPNPDALAARLGRKRKRREQPGSLDEARSLLWRALTRAGELLDHQDEEGVPDAQTALRAVHAISQGVAAYAKVVEVGELEARIKALEEAQGEPAGRGPRLGGAA